MEEVATGCQMKQRRGCADTSALTYAAVMEPGPAGRARRVVWRGEVGSAQAVW